MVLLPRAVGMGVGSWWEGSQNSSVEMWKAGPFLGSPSLPVNLLPVNLLPVNQGGGFASPRPLPSDLQIFCL